MTVQIKMKDELEAFAIKGGLSDFAGELNIAAASGKQFVVVPDANDKPRMIAVHNISWANEVEDEGAVW